MQSLQQLEVQTLLEPQTSSVIRGKLFHLSSAGLISERDNASLVSHGHYKAEIQQWKWDFWGPDSETDKRLTSAPIFWPLEGRLRTTYTLCIPAVNVGKPWYTQSGLIFPALISGWVKLIYFFLLINENSLHCSDCIASAEWFHSWEWTVRGLSLHPWFAAFLCLENQHCKSLSR